MNWKRKTGGGLIAFIGFMLSPLSWWNDLFVNIPIAVALGWIVALFYKPAFEPAVIIGYWLTNVLGLVLMQKGAQRILSEENRRYSRKDLVRDIGLSLAHTALIVALFKLGVIGLLEFGSGNPGR